jgi:proteasome lid subunit RPN8/RPN11
MKQRVSTTKVDGGYEGTYLGYDFRVEKTDDGWWGIAAGIGEASGKLKRNVVNDLTYLIDEQADHDSFAQETEEASDSAESYEDAMYGGTPMFHVELVRERDFAFAERHSVETPYEAGDFLLPYFENHDRESVVVLMMDAGQTVIGIHELSVGGLTASVVDVKNIFKAAILANASSIIIAHNHPSGNPEPSRADIQITEQVREAGEVMDIPLLDHLVIGDTVTSIRERMGW